MPSVRNFVRLHTDSTLKRLINEFSLPVPASTLELILSLASTLNLAVSIAGGVNISNIAAVIKAGAQVVVCLALLWPYF